MKALKTLILGLLLCLTGCECTYSSRPAHDYRDDGRRAHRAGVPANANPGRFQTASNDWLEGWMEEAESVKKQKEQGK